ncbi:alpha/beta-hydrolase [Xylaria telfairii]|nr:alpha/beta-hydrolase [Xylaria telfairii]
MMAADLEEHAAARNSGATAGEVMPYRIHVLSRYLNLTKQKLEIVRLPHEVDEPRSKDWWQPKSQVEPLIDFWLEQYQWRDHEKKLNELPQFRTGFTIPQSDSPIRIQFIHVRSSRANVIPLLLIPPFPFSSLSVPHLVRLFTEPEDANQQPFHLVVPSLPGLGFSDPLPTNSPVISSTADLLDGLMKRLDYPHYLVTNAGAAALSPAQIDYKLADWLATRYPDSCLGTHLISPPLAQPRARQAPLSWAKWSIAKFFQASILGYRAEDYSALKKSGGTFMPPPKVAPIPRFGLSGAGLTEPNTLSYALCDSPTGLLVFVMKGLRLLAPKKEFSPTEIINFTQLAWIPGPEAALRFWAHCARHPERSDSSSGNGKKSTKKPRVSLTVFLGDEKGEGSSRGEDAEVGFATAAPPYSCPAWARTRYDVLHSHRAAGDPGLLAWERPELIAAGVRALAAAVLRIDKRLQPVGRPETAQTVVAEAGAETATTPAPTLELQQQQQQQAPFSVSDQPPLGLGLMAPPKMVERLMPVREISEDTKVASEDFSATPSPIQSSSPQPAVVTV